MMGKLLYIVGTFLLSGSIKQMLLGAGIGLASASFILTITNRYIDSAIANMQGIGGAAIQIMGLSGLDVALSIVIGAVIARATINAMRVSITKSTT